MSLYKQFKMTPSFKDSDLDNAYVEGFNHALKLADAEFLPRKNWIARMCKILGYDNSDGFHSEPDPFTIAKRLVKNQKTK